jgi:hypothetical protein
MHDQRNVAHTHSLHLLFYTVAGCVPVVLSDFQRVNFPFKPYIPWQDLIPTASFTKGKCSLFTNNLMAIVRDVPRLECIQERLSPYRRLVAYGYGNPFSDNATMFEATDMILRHTLAHAIRSSEDQP